MDTIHGFTRACIVTPFLSKVRVAKTLSILTMTTTIIITKVLNVHDPMIGMMGALSWVTSFMVWALATQGWMMYLATGLSSIGTSVLVLRYSRKEGWHSHSQYSDQIDSWITIRDNAST